MSSLEDIAIFTEKEDMPLGKVFDMIYEKANGGTAVDSKADSEQLRSWFEEILPEYSREKVYSAILRKLPYGTIFFINLICW